MATGLGLAVLAAAALGLKDRAVEQWNIWKLDSTDFTERFRAARKLGELRCTRAIPALVELLEESAGHHAEAREVWGAGVRGDALLDELFEQLGPPAVPELARAVRETRGERHYWRRYACRALGATGAKEAVPVLMELLDDDDPCVGYIAISTLGSMGEVASESLPALQRKMEGADTRGAVHRVLSEAIAGIQEPPDGTHPPRAQ